MKILKNISIKQKLTGIVMLTSSIALLLACTVFIVYDRVTVKQSMVKKLEILADIIGSNSTAAITFNNKDDANETLAALRAEQHIIAACVYTKDRQPFAIYIRSNENDNIILPRSQSQSHFFGKNSLSLFRQIILDEEPIGTIFLQADLQEINTRLQRFAGMVAVVIVVSSLVAFLITSRFQRVISNPILQLAHIARDVSVEKDYSVRAEKHYHDEVGLLVDSFNEMLFQIHKRDIALQNVHEELEDRVKERTIELENEVSERKKAEEELKKFAAKLEQSNCELQEFASVASHDLQEPLRKVLAFGDRLKVMCGEELSEKGRDYLERMQSAASRMQVLIEDLLTFSRVTSKAKPFVVLDLQKIAKEVISDLEITIDHCKGKVEVGELPVINADPLQMRQLFQNLIGNGLKFHKVNESPIVKINSQIIEKQSQDSSEDSSVQQFYQIVIEDNGIGFDEKYSDKIFNIFQRLHSRSEYKGTGIGLAVCRKIVERHDGTITATSKQGKGAKFIITIPLRQHNVVESDEERKETTDISRELNFKQPVT